MKVIAIAAALLIASTEAVTLKQMATKKPELDATLKDITDEIATVKKLPNAITKKVSCAHGGDKWNKEKTKLGKGFVGWTATQDKTGATQTYMESQVPLKNAEGKPDGRITIIKDVIQGDFDGDDVTIDN